MSQYNDGSIGSFESGESIAQYLRVDLESTGLLSVAGITDREIGQADTAAFAANQMIPVRFSNAPGTCIMVASVALAVGAAVYTAAAGKVGASASTAYYIGKAKTASTADGDHIEVIRVPHGDEPVA